MALNSTPITWTAGSVVTAAQLNTEVRDALTGIQAAWTVYTPTWTGSVTNPVLGNGTFTARYMRYGKTIIAQIVTSLGSTTTIGSGNYSWTLPVTAILTGHVAIGTGNFFDSSATTDLAGWTALLGSATTVQLKSTTGTSVGSATPVVPASLDQISICVTYEAA